MGETGGEVVDPFLGLDRQDADDALNPLDVLLDLLDEPQAHVGRDLVVAAPASVQLAANVLADDFAQATLVGRVDVLVVLLDLERAVLPLLLHLVEAAVDLGQLVRGEDGRRRLGQRQGVRLGAGNIDGVQRLVVREALVELPHAEVGTSAEGRAVVRSTSARVHSTRRARGSWRTHSGSVPVVKRPPQSFLACNVGDGDGKGGSAGPFAAKSHAVNAPSAQP